MKQACLTVVIAALFSVLLFGCAPAIGCQATGTCSPTPSPSILRPADVTPTYANLPTSVASNPYHLTASQFSQLGNSSQSFVLKRTAVLERFANGVMLVFARSDQGFDAGGEYILALAKDGHAWRIADTWVEPSKNPNDWYTCDAKPGLRPERSGVPWRGFGKAWCDHAEVRTALGAARSYEESEVDSSFQSYANGRAFRIPDWRGIPGWNGDQAYLVILDSSDPTFAAGHWEQATN